MSAVVRWAGQGVARRLPGAFCPCTGVPGRVTGRWPPQGGPGKRARAAEWDTLLMCCARKGTEGSNPSASALAPGSSGSQWHRPAASVAGLHDRSVTASAGGGSN